MNIEYFKQIMLTQTGKDHLPDNTPCQDSVAYNTDQSVHVLVVSDGAGSKRLSHFGSQCIVDTLSKHLPYAFTDYLLLLEKSGKTNSQIKLDDQQIKDSLMKTMLNDLRRVAMRENCLIDDLAATLLFVAFSQDHYIAGHIGDGFIASYHTNGNQDVVRVVSEPEGEANLTIFVTTQGAEDHLRLTNGSMHEIRGFFLASDGIQERCFHPRFGLTSAVNQFFTLAKKVDAQTFQSNFQKLTKDTWKELYDDLSINLIFKDVLPLNDVTKATLEPYLSKIKSVHQIIKRSPYACLIDASIPYDAVDFITSDALFERIKRL
jgi:serine/threonine protein phosphatase PrpC